MIKAMSWTSRIIWSALLLSVLILVLAPLLSRFGILPFMLGFYGIGIAALIAIIAALIALVRMVPVLRDQGKTHLLGALVIGLLIPGYLFYLFSGARAAPPIHDVTTNLNNPPQFETITPRQYEGPRLFTKVQRRALHEVGYRKLAPLVVEASVQKATQAALEAINSMGMNVAASDTAAGHIEATDTTFWFGFKDDVVVRVEESPEGGSVIDIRSVSRVGIGDVGANAKRIKAIQDKISKTLS
jgi:uncharacterized protein (DUF1499 family)